MSDLDAGPARRAEVIGTGLIGASVGMALRRAGWFVTGSDLDPERSERALALGALDAVGEDPTAALTVVAVPVGAVPAAARRALSHGGVVTDVGSVKAPVVAAVDDPRFVGGHPMAGSEALGPEGARADLFDGAVWVLTPTARTDSAANAMVHSVLRSLGADVVTLDPAQHDRMVATISHVPHLVAATLMRLASDRGSSEASLLRLAAGGFRDMTRVAAGDPAMWIDICAENRSAILDVLDSLVESLVDVRRIVADGDAAVLEAHLHEAHVARRSLPTGAPPPDQLAEVRVPIPDRAGEFSAVAALASAHDINVYDLEIAHQAGVPTGLLILVVAADRADELAGALRGTGRAASVHELG